MTVIAPVPHAQVLQLQTAHPALALFTSPKAKSVKPSAPLLFSKMQEIFVQIVAPVVKPVQDQEPLSASHA